jgi:pimeloyl-ACP methyl ester carboxylesterase
LNPVNYEVKGEHNSARILLLNPFFSNAKSWNIILPNLTSKYEVVLVEYPGFGGAPTPPMESVEEYSERVHYLVGNLPDKPLHIIGYSFGSWVAQQIASRYQNNLRSLTLIGSSNHIYQHGIHIVDEWLNILEALGVKAVLMQLGIWSFSTHTFEQKPGFLDAYVGRSMDACSNLEVLKNFLVVCRAYRQGAPLNKIKAPTLILRGENDFMYPKFCSVSLHESIEHSRMIEIPNAAHAALWENTARMVELITNFLEANAYRHS